MANPILIHVNKKYHIPLVSIIKVKQKKHGSVYVYYKDKNNQTKIAISKYDGKTMIGLINQYLTVFFKQNLSLEIEK